MTSPGDTSGMPTKPKTGDGHTDPAWTMSLINNLMRAPLDPGYEAAARKRKAEGKPSSAGLRSPLLIVTLLVIGLCLAVAGHALRVPKAASDKRRTELINTIKDRQHDIDADTKTITATQKEIDSLQAKALSRQDDTTVVKRLNALGVSTGATAARGPGLVLTVNDAPDASVDAQGNPRTDSSSQGRLTSTDLQIIVNGLWEAGAEAVSINGQRVASQTAIRFAGQAILVNFRALSPPYDITVIGGPTVADNFKNDSGGAYLRALVSQYQIREKLSTKSSVTVPATATVPLAHARVPATSPKASSQPKGGS